MDIREAIKKLRGTQPGNQMTMLVCDELEKRLSVPATIKGQRPIGEKGCPVCNARRKAKTLAMRRWREKQRKGR